MFKKQIIPFRSTNISRKVTRFNYIPHSITTSPYFKEYSFSICHARGRCYIKCFPEGVIAIYQGITGR